MNLRYISTIFFCCWISFCLAQIRVSTITEPFKGSGGLSLDQEGNLIVADFGDFLSAGDNDGQRNNIWKIDKSGERTIFAPGFIGASGNNFNNNGVLFQSDIGESRIYRVENNRRVLVTATGISNPVGLVFDKDDNMYVCNCGNNTIRKITPGGQSTLFSSGTIFRCPNGITIDHEQNLYVSNFSNGSLIKINRTGVPSLFATIPGGNNGHLRYFEPDSVFIVASHGSSRIYKVDLNGRVETLAGSGIRGNADGSALEASFSRPNGVAISTTGDTIYINSSVPLTDVPNRPLNPSLIRMITGVKGLTTSVENKNARIEQTSIQFQVTNQELQTQIITDIPQQLVLHIYDMSGRLQFEEKWRIETVGQQVKKISLSALATGSFIATLYEGGRVLKSQAFVKNP